MRNQYFLPVLILLTTNTKIQNTITIQHFTNQPLRVAHPSHSSTIMGSTAQTKALNAALLIAGLASAVLMYQYASRQKVLVAKRLKDTEDKEEECLETSQDKVTSTPKSSKKDSSEKTPLTSNKSGRGATGVEDVDEEGNEEDDDAVQLHTQIEEIDKRGKVLFKSKKYLEASEVFSEAIDLINSKVSDVAKNSNMKRQMVTLMNNRSAMYEKGDLADLALVGELHFCERPFLYPFERRQITHNELHMVNL
jgi:hypothetical protein